MPEEAMGFRPGAVCRVGVGIVLADGRGHVLVGRRKGSHGAGRLALPGGHLELGESWAECARRELEEETGILTSASTFAHVATTNDVMPADHVNGTPAKHYITIFMQAQLPQGQAPTNLEPHKNEGWEFVSWAALQQKPDNEIFIPLRNLLASGYAPAWSRIPIAVPRDLVALFALASAALLCINIKRAGL